MNRATKLAELWLLPACVSLASLLVISCCAGTRFDFDAGKYARVVGIVQEEESECESESVVRSISSLSQREWVCKVSIVEESWRLQMEVQVPSSVVD